MNYEKKYKEALSRARQFSEHPLQEDSDSIVEYIFPELAKSEDEKIRKALIRFHKSTIDIDGIKGADVIAWLEKQGGRNNYDNNVITRNDEMLQAISIGLSDIKEDVGWSDFGGTPIEEIQEWLEKQGEQKPTWSEEDEKIITGIINDIQKRLEDYPLEQLAEIYFKEIKWLKSLRKRIEGE